VCIVLCLRESSNFLSASNCGLGASSCGFGGFDDIFSEYDATSAIPLSCSALRGRGCDWRKVGVDFDVGQMISQPSDSGSSDQLTIVEFNTLQVMT